MNTTTEIPRCSPHLLQKMQSMGVKTTGTRKAMEQIVKRKGYALPGELWETFAHFNSDGQKETVSHLMFGFSLQHKGTAWVRITFSYEDALANEIILLKELELI